MVPFLKGVAQAYLSLPRHLLREYCFLFPNKRSAAFFRKYLAEGLSAGEAMLAPEIVTVNDLMERLSGLVVDSHLDLLLTLYNSYISLLVRKEISDPDPSSKGGGALPEFDSFIRWGETVLNDFNDVDLFCVNREMVFRNVKDFRTISTDYLTESQKEVMKEYFNIEPSLQEAQHFWEHYPEKSDKGAGRFRLLWEILAPLYKEFSGRLLERGLATQGMATRTALDNVREKGREILPFSKIVAVGFNVLTVAEYELFIELKKLRCDGDFIVGDHLSFADFLWDATGPVLGGETDPDNSASRFVRHNIRKFPAPDWVIPFLESSFTDSLPKLLESVAAPSNSMQAKIAASILERDIIPEMPLVKVEKDGQTYEKPDMSAANVAVVLPDEGLLFPLLYALPDNVDLNLTMGYPLRQTAAISFVTLLRKVLSRRRLRADGVLVFYKPDFLAFLTHPFVAACGGVDAVRRLGDALSALRVSEVSATDMLKAMGEEADGLSPLAVLIKEVASVTRTAGASSVESALEVITHIERIMDFVKKSLWGSSKEEVPLASNMDVAHVDIYIDALWRLREAISLHRVAISEKTVLYLADRLLGAEKVEFEGEPLSGLQVIGLLETRGLDFEYLIIPSLNERIFPRKARSRSFIPDVLRNSYGMPPSNYQESLFSYYFFRMISRAKKVWMIHDARMSSGSRNGEPSRYLSQLRHLYAPEIMTERECAFVIPEQKITSADMVKTDDVMKSLEIFRRRSDRPLGSDTADTLNLSASSLKHYLSCPVKFYYQDVAGLREKDEFSEDIDAIGMGNIFHKVMENLYPQASPVSPKVVDKPFLRSLLDTEGLILASVREAVATEHFKLKNKEEIGSLLSRGLSGGVEMVAEGIADNVRKVITHDLTLAPFMILGSELKETFAFPVVPSDGSEPFNVNMKFAIDRLDLVTIKEGKGKDARMVKRLRIVDYKTGASHVSASSFNDIFSASREASHIFQLMLYARMMEYWKEYRGFHPDLDLALIQDPAMEIYEVGDMSASSPRVIPQIGGEGKSAGTIYSYSQVGEEFASRLDSVLSEIFDRNIPFRHSSDQDTCAFCHLKSLCRR
ncbi:MAG: hypothetical protein HDS82_00840 [Bacteroidales bacterium]|nr:hypothetical protein [Bacteroidales bacterium]